MISRIERIDPRARGCVHREIEIGINLDDRKDTWDGAIAIVSPKDGTRRAAADIRVLLGRPFLRRPKPETAAASPNGIPSVPRNAEVTCSPSSINGIPPKIPVCCGGSVNDDFAVFSRYREAA
jgi:hypothetical protein